MMKLYRININMLDDPLENKRLLELVGTERRKKVIRYRMPDDRKRSVGAGIIINKILDENGLSESCLKYSENGKPVADNLFFNVSHAGDYVVGVSSDCEVGCDIEKIVNAPLKIAEQYFNEGEERYIKSACDPDKAFFTLWTLKESYMKMTGKGMSLSLDSFEIIRTETGFVLGKTPEKRCFFGTMEFDGYSFSVSNETDFDLKQLEFYDIMSAVENQAAVKTERNHKMSYQIAIDGPAGAGKSTIARRVAREKNFIYVDTGAMYRAMAYYLLREKADPSDEEEISEKCTGAHITIRYQDGEQVVLLNGENVNPVLRTEEVGNMASVTSKNKKVRERLTQLQKELAEKNSVVMDGRDIGTCVLPQADVKVYLTASAAVRAKRRFDELTAKGESCDIQKIEADIVKRDEQDMTREIAPLKQAEDAVLVDSSDMSIDEVVEKILSLTEA